MEAAQDARSTALILARQRTKKRILLQRGIQSRSRLLLAFIARHAFQYLFRESLYVGKQWTGLDRITDILNTPHPDRHLHCFRMQKSTFRKLVAFVGARRLVEGTADVTVEEKLAIFLQIVSSGVSYRDVREYWRRGLQTISKAFHEVLAALQVLHQEVVKLPDQDYTVDSRVSSSPKYMPYFQHCLGALDGTHVYAKLPSAEIGPFRNRKGIITQNVLAICTFDLQFCFVYPGWEGSAHDTRVLDDARETGGFMIPKGKFYLADAGYPNKEYFLSPYRSTRYHLRETALANLKPSTPRELFNLRHSSLRNAVERIFGILKRRFKCLASQMEYSFPTQVNIVFALTALHNFIRQNENVDLFEKAEMEVEKSRQADVGRRGEYIPTSGRRGDRANKEAMDTFRDKMAADMWEDYQSVLTQRAIARQFKSLSGC